MPTVTSNQNSIHQASAGQFIPAKVVDVVLDMNFPDIEKIGGWDALGTILYIKVSDIITDPEIEYKRNQQTLIAANSLARPLFSNQKYYPLKGEIVLLFSATGRDIITDTKETYYLNNINIWNHPHHNALPNPDTYNGTHPKDNNDKTKNDYLKSTGGLVRQVQDGDTEIPLGAYFDEKLDTKPLLPFEGDYILEGRFGNSIRFGATAPGPNNWSTVGKTGDPITILRNGQSDELDKKGWEPTTEDVNRDPSSIYLTSTQKLDKFVPASLNWQSWGAKPTIIEDPIEALSSPVLEEYVAPLPPEDITDDLIATAPTGSVDIVAEEIIAEDNIKIKDSPEKEQDELSLYDELIESGDFDEDDFEEGEDATISGQDLAADSFSDMPESGITNNTTDNSTDNSTNNSTNTGTGSSSNKTWKQNYDLYNGNKKSEMFKQWGYKNWNYPIEIIGANGHKTTVNAPAPWEQVKKTLGPTSSKKTELIIHCTAGGLKNFPIESIMMMIHSKDRVEILGGNKAGYHFMIGGDGKVTQVNKDDVSAPGAKNHNAQGIQVNWMGGHKSFNMTNAQAATLNKIVKHYVTVRYPSMKVLGHNQVTTGKSCPRFFVPAYARKLGIPEKNIYAKVGAVKEGGEYAQVENIVNAKIT